MRYQSDRGIHLSTIGFGMGNYNDVLMETLADKGDGNYYYVDRIEEAARVFRENLTGTLQTLGRDAKIQVEFDPEQVARWRLIGYENRDVADRDFRNDAVDAGEIGAGHRVVALYEIKLAGEAERAVDGRADRNEPLRLGTLRLRYEKPEQDRRAGEVIELERRLSTADLSPRHRAGGCPPAPGRPGRRVRRDPARQLLGAGRPSRGPGAPGRADRRGAAPRRGGSRAGTPHRAGRPARGRRRWRR